MTTAFDLIKGAMRPINVLTGQTTLTTEEAEDALTTMNWMLRSWSGEPATIFKVTRESFTLVSGKNPQTWGPGGDWDSERPVEIKTITVTIQGVDYEVIPLGYDDYEAIKLKTLATSWPQYMYSDMGYPLINNFLWPVPTGGVINVQSEKLIQEFDSLYDEVILPPGYEDAIRYNLALRLAPEYQLTAGPDLIKLAEKTLKAIKRTNSKPTTMAVDPSLSGPWASGYNVFTDGYR